ncbi:cellobiose 2-epimerase [Bacteroidia bacterium]|nr:cellobiose 2-epimerase [Bacteroidia bacterium]GHU58802.1 cellobiose 2-epimerase [Bacteroidia bacterium]
MKKVFVVATMLLVLATSCDRKTPEEKIVDQLKLEIAQDLTENILPFWATHSVDPKGGFYGFLNYDGTPKPDAPKGGILNARLLWTYSTAYRILKDEKYLELANRAQVYFISNFRDKPFGGTFLMLNADGTPLDSTKMVYQQAFAIYGLSEHYRATGNEVSLHVAVDVFNELMNRAHDVVDGGFVESFKRNWEEIPTRAPKTMNTNLHVLEALTNLYRVWPEPELRDVLREQIFVMCTKILNPQTWHEQLYLTMDWQNLADIDSYGHDIEFSWLLVEAAEALGEEEAIKETQRIAVKLAETQLTEGVDENGAMLYEKGPGENRVNLEWWPQAESVVGFLNAWQISGDKKFLNAALKSWTWIKTYMIDYEYGEWYGHVNADYTPKKDDPKASQWRCPYHNSRMGFEVLTRFPNTESK